MNRLIFNLNALKPLGSSNNLTRQTGAVSLASKKLFSSDDKPKTLAFQEQLGKLPIPEIKDTVSKFLLTAKPHLSEDEYQTTAKKLMQLTEPNGIGEKLQKLLLERRDQKLNWFADWWLEMAYLAYRDPVPVWSSPGFAFPHKTFQNKEQQLEYAAKLIVGVLDFKTLLDKELLPVEYMGKSPMDMKTYYNLFGVNRVPQENVDKLVYYSNSKHIIVAHNKNFFKLVVKDDAGKWLNYDQMLNSLMNIVDESDNLGPGVPVGGLTSDNRDNWAKAYQILNANNINAESIHEIESSLFTLCLDADTSHVNMPDSLSKTALQSLHGFSQNFENRWFDKTINFFVGESGESGCISEHSPADGVVVMKICDHAFDYMNGKVTIDQTPAENLPQPTPLHFHLDDEVFKYLKLAKDHAEGLIDDLQMRVLNFHHFGKDTIKTFRVSPDSFVQMALQYAFYRTHNVPGATYESGGTRLYHEGRTECIRSCSIESVNFAKAMLDNAASDTEKYNCLMNAVKGHNAYAKMATQGLGVDRHFQGMKKAAQLNGLPIPDIYDDPGYTRSARMRLSTSQISSGHGSFTCFGPLQMDGYGCCYSINKNNLIVSISSMRSNKETCSDTFKSNLEQSFLDMQEVCLRNLPSKL